MQRSFLRIILFGALVILATVLVILTKWEVLSEKYVYHDDAAQIVYWEVRQHEPQAFPDDLLADYSSNVKMPGIKAFHYVLTWILDPVTVGKWLWLIHLPLAIYFLFRLGETFSGPWGGFLNASIVMTACWGSITDGPGSGGDLAVLLFAGFTWAISERRYGIVGLFLIASCFLYPIALMVLLTVLPLVLIRRERLLGLGQLERRQILWLGSVVLFCVGWNLLKFLYLNENEFGELVSREMFFQMPEFGPDGRFPMRCDTLLDWLWSDTCGLAMNPVLISLFVCAILFLSLRPRDAGKIGRAPWALLGAGMILFIAATASIPSLFKPTKYLHLPFSITLGCIVSMYISHSGRNAKSRAARAAILISPVFVLTGIAYPHLNVRTYRAPDAPLYCYLQTLPDDALIAAHPGLANHIPVFARRSILAGGEMALPLYMDYYGKVKERINDFFRAYYTDDALQVIDFCKEHSVDYLVVSDYHYSPEYLGSEQRYFEPFDEVIERKVSDPDNIFLLHLPDDLKLFSYSFKITEALKNNSFHWNGMRQVETEDVDEGPDPPGGPSYEMFVASCQAISARVSGARGATADASVPGRGP
ncbi:hypothetical protein ACFL4G_08520 [Thermodesulfobacteriota bacterium]